MRLRQSASGGLGNSAAIFCSSTSFPIVFRMSNTLSERLLKRAQVALLKDSAAQMGQWMRCAAHPLRKYSAQTAAASAFVSARACICAGV